MCAVDGRILLHLAGGEGGREEGEEREGGREGGRKGGGEREGEREGGRGKDGVRWKNQ